MLREGELTDFSNGRTYGLNDMVKADTGNCENCHKCCTGMGTSIVLDPYDVMRLSEATKLTFEELIAKEYIELNMVDGLILPNLCMGKNDKCSFLNEKGRCSIHEGRPGICRLFPLGRVYDEKGFSYFVQDKECAKKNLAKIKVKKWISEDNIQENQEFILKWHRFIRETGDGLKQLRDTGKGDRVKEIAMYVLNEFFVKKDLADYAEINKRIDIARETIMPMLK